MSRIVNDDEAITNQKDILNELVTFYTNLYNKIIKNVIVVPKLLLTSF